MVRVPLVLALVLDLVASSLGRSFLGDKPLLLALVCLGIPVALAGESRTY